MIKFGNDTMEKVIHAALKKKNIVVIKMGDNVSWIVVEGKTDLRF